MRGLTDIRFPYDNTVPDTIVQHGREMGHTIRQFVRRPVWSLRQVAPRPFRPTSSYPHWMLIGVPKAGTTSLYQAIQGHTQVYVPATKETHFFSSLHYNKGLNYYLKTFFPDVAPTQRAGDMSPKYLAHRGTPWRIRRHLGREVRFVVILRDPVARAWSHYCHAYDRFRHTAHRPTENLRFDEALRQEPMRLQPPNEYADQHGIFLAYFYFGLYDVQLAHWFNVFDRGQFLILLLEDFVQSPQPALKRFFDHIGVEDLSQQLTFPAVNAYSRPGLDPSIRDRLRRAYRPHIERTQTLIDRDLSHWLHED